MNDLRALARTLEARLTREAATYGLVPPLHAAYVHNPGGYMSASFTVTGAGGRRVHLKLSTEARELDRWWRLRELLALEYRAPEVLERLEIPEAGLVGLVFPHLEGSVPDAAQASRLLPEVLDLLARLHADEDLASQLAEWGVPTRFECFETGLFECLSEDLVSVKADPEVRTWLSLAELDELTGEVDRVRSLGREILDDTPCRTAVHGDLWFQNVLVTETSWFLLDWDCMGLEDEAGDYATLTYGPWVPAREVLDRLPPDPALRTRVEFLIRAVRFDSIVDPLSDCTGMPVGLEGREATRAEKRRVSREALARYRDLYG